MRRPSGAQSGCAFQLVSSSRTSVIVAPGRASMRQIPPVPQTWPRFDTRRISRPSGDHAGER